MQDVIAIGKNIKLLREKSGFSRRQIAHYLGVSVQQVSKYESGANRLPVEKLFWLHKFFAVPYEYFFAGLDMEEKKEEPEFIKEEIRFRLAKVADADLCARIRDIVMVLTR